MTGTSPRPRPPRPRCRSVKSTKRDGVAEGVRHAVESASITAARVIATSRIAICLGVAGVYEVADALLQPIERAAASTGRAQPEEPAARAFLLSANVARASRQGDIERAAVLAQDAVVCFDLLGDVRNAARQRQSAGWALSELGAYTIAEGVLIETCRDAERLGLLSVANDAKLRLGHLYVRTNRAADAIRLTTEVIDGFAAQRDRFGEGRARAYLAGVHYFANELDAAEEEELRALPLLEDSVPYRAALMGFMTLTLLNKGAPGDAVYLAGTEAMRLLEAVGGVAEGEALIRLAYAEALFAKGDIAAAKAAISAARARLLARAAKIENPEYKRTFLAVVREHARTLMRAGEWLL
jgi:eukaryotic-like serine/threonine-protein kinase